jgi:NADP-dependent 3-hydroxy acid dehydrogenase YdfG
VDDYRSVIDTNLNGAFYCMRCLLPAMRKKGGGTIVLIVSDAGIIANAKAGAAYVASKFAARGLVQSINAEERQNGIRATSLCPGDINTPILDKRPVPPAPEAREKMLQPEDVAECVMLAINLPSRAVVEELIIRPR